MATQNQPLDINWVDIKASLSLVDDQKYTIQNTGAFEIRIIEAAATPEDDEYGHQLEANDLLDITPAAGFNFYVRVIGKNFTSNLTVTEAE